MWRLQWGAHSKFLTNYGNNTKRTPYRTSLGKKKPKAMVDMPKVPEQFIWVIHAYNNLAELRPRPVQRLTMLEMNEYIKTYPVADKDLFIRLIKSIDRVWCGYMRTK